MTKPMLPSIEDDCLYDTAVSGAYLGFTPNTLRNSRSKGKLAGVEPPAHIKMGTVVRYRGATLKSWRAQFAERVTANVARR